MTTINYFNAVNRINKSFYTGTVGLSIMDETIKKAFNTGYLHHIERLMIMGNLMNLMGIHPDDVYSWFMEFAVDSYDLVMINNVYSMALYSDGGLTTTKAYISSSLIICCIPFPYFSVIGNNIPSPLIICLNS